MTVSGSIRLFVQFSGGQNVELTSGSHCTWMAFFFGGLPRLFLAGFATAAGGVCCCCCLVFSGVTLPFLSSSPSSITSWSSSSSTSSCSATGLVLSSPSSCSGYEMNIQFYDHFCQDNYATERCTYTVVQHVSSAVSSWLVWHELPLILD